MKVKSSLALDGHVEVTQVVTPGGEADEAGDEEGVTLDELPAGVAVDDDPSQYESWNKSTVMKCRTVNDMCSPSPNRTRTKAADTVFQFSLIFGCFHQNLMGSDPA